MHNIPWPNGARCAVVLSFDVDGEAGLLGPKREHQTRLSALSHAAFGPDVGVPRILDLLKRYALSASFHIPGYTAELYPHRVEEVVKGGHEVGHHGYLHERLDELGSEAEEEEILQKGIEALRKITGEAPVGYRAPWWEINPWTPALLKRCGFIYDSSLMGNDAPYTIEAGDGPLLELPVSWLMDDWEQYAYSVVPRFGYVIEEPDKAVRLWMAEFEGLYEIGGCFMLTMHPQLTGRISRLKALEKLIRQIQGYPRVWWTTSKAIAEFWAREGLE